MIHPCDPENLELLLDGDEKSPAFEQAARHVDTCPICQQRITELSGNTAHWSTQREMLTPLDGDDQQTGRLSRYRSSELFRSSVDESTIRNLLGPASHPEMLGRLGRYEIERVIGSGGMGIVLKGFDCELHRPVAIKMLAPHLARIGAARQRFAREARAAAAVVHEHVVAIHNVESDAATPFLVMQFIPGESLQARVDREGPLRVSEILRIGVQAASGLAAAHAQGLVHRDVKPANILLENGVDRAYLTDFGLARASDDASLTCSGIVAGTPHYMSPEQANGLALDARSDLFSLGSVLYFMATGHPPFRAEHPMAVLKRTCHDPHRPAWQFNREIPAALSRIIDRLLEKQPGRRYANAADLEQALSQVLSDVQQGRPARFRWPGRWTRRAAWRAMAALAAMAILVAAVISLMFGPMHPDARDADGQTGRSSATSAAPSASPEVRGDGLPVDPSPPDRSQTELDALWQDVRTLESLSYPESFFTPSEEYQDANP